jgi:methylenetetrahydrofolate dehydrogenase (NADP+) / methenyltetrahydrofolate cyclohydrolase
MNQTLQLKAQPYIDSQKEQLTQEVRHWQKQGITPHLHAILVGENQASLKYLTNKQKMCSAVGAEFSLKNFDNKVRLADFKKHIDEVNKNPKIHGCMIQLPVEGEIKSLNLSELVQPHKDVDGFHPQNVYGLFNGEFQNRLIPCTPKGIMSLLNFYKIDVSGKQVLILGRSLIVGKPLSMLMTHFNATVTLAHSKTQELQTLVNQADIIVTAIGKARFLNKNNFSSLKKPIVVDVGINLNQNQLVGDVAFDEIAPLCKAITPVPGGIGPMTVISLIENLLLAVKKQNQKATA